MADSTSEAPPVGILNTAAEAEAMVVVRSGA